MYANGQGVAQDYAQAVAWYRKAADQGNADAQLNLGVMYANGRGVAQDAVSAYALYNLSASNYSSQDNYATSNRQIISEHMTESQIEEGQALTRRMKSEGVLKTIDHIPSRPRTPMLGCTRRAKGTNPGCATWVMRSWKTGMNGR